MLDLKQIPLFDDFSDESIAKLTEILHPREASNGEVLLEEGKTVPGMFIVVDGDVNVEFENRILAKIKQSGVFGEMSFLSENKEASATIKVNSEKAKLYFCEREKFEKEIESNDRFSRDFFKGVSLLVSERLRRTNEKINSELTLGFSNIADIVAELDENSKIDQTKESLDRTGAHIVSKLKETISKLEVLKHNHPEETEEFQSILSDLQDIIFEDAQTFDRICQKIDQIKQYFNNLKTIIRGAGIFGIKGDKNLFKESSGSESTVEFL